MPAPAPLHRPPAVLRKPRDPLIAPLWVLAACAVAWTVMAAVWFMRAERAVSAARDAMREAERREATREMPPDEDLARRLREKYGVK